MASSHVQLQVELQAYVQATLNQWYVADLFRHFLELRIAGHCTSLCGVGIAEDEVSVKAGVATHPSIGYLPEKIYWIHSSWGPSEV